MKVSIALNNFTKLYDELFSEEDNQLLTKDGISFLTVFSSIINVHGFLRYQSQFAWSKLCIIILKSFVCVLLQMVRSCSLINNNAKASKSNLLIVCNTNLAFREIYKPLISASDLYKIKILFTNSHVKAICSEDVSKLGCFMVLNKNQNIWKDLTLLCKMIAILLKYFAQVKSLYDPISRQKIYLITYSFFSSLPRLFYTIRHLQSIDDDNFHAMVSDDVNDPCVRYVVEYCKKRKIKTNVLQFGHYDVESVEWKFVNSSIIYAWGSYYKKLFSTFDVHSSIEIKVVGSPRFDYLFTGSFCKNPCQTKKKIIVLSTYTIDSYSQISDDSAIPSLKAQLGYELSEYVNTHNVIIIVKPHPYESDGELKIWNELRSKDFQILDRNYDIREIINSADVVISFGTGLTIDCLVAGIPVLLPSWNNYPWEYGALVLAGAVEVNKKDQLAEMLLRLSETTSRVNLTDGVIKEFVAQNSAVSSALIKDIME